MTILVDTSALLAFYDRGSADHEKVVAAFRAAPAPLSVSPLVLAEFDFLITKYAGARAAVVAAREIGAAMHIEAFGAADVLAASEVMARYQDLKLGLTDASLVVLAARCRTDRLLTLDRRHFSVVRPLSNGDAFELLPN